MEKIIVKCKIGSSQQDEVMNFYRNEEFHEDLYVGFRDFNIVGIGFDDGEGLNVYQEIKEISNWEQFKVYSFEEWKKSLIPEKWCIKTTHKTRIKIQNFINNQGYESKLSGDYYVHFPFIDGGSAYHDIQKNYIEITYEQFKQITMKTIIGYRCPTNLFGDNSDTVCGTLFVKTSEYAHWYTTKSESHKAKPNYILPKEIVESWVPVFEEKEIVRIGSNAIDVEVTNVFTFRNKETASIESVLRTYTSFSSIGTIGSYGVIIRPDQRVLLIGCVGEDNRVSLNELETLIKTYNKVNGTNF